MEGAYPHLSRAPITEAVLDIRADGVAMNDARYDDFAAAVRSEFPNKRPIKRVHAQFDAGAEDTSAPIEREVVGHIFWNTENTRAVQARADGFAVNYVRSYSSWQELRADAERYWSEYVRIMAPARVVRCALRYVNRLEVPILVDLSTVFRTRPEVTSALPALIDDFFMRAIVPADSDRKVAITQASEPVLEEQPSRRGVILDIDAFSRRVFSGTDAGIWAEFEELRTLKNRSFFESLQQDIWESYR